MHRQTNRLPNGRRNAIHRAHNPWLQTTRAKAWYGCYARPERESFKRLMERYSDQEDEKRRAYADGEGEPDEDAVEEDAGFEEEALEDLALFGGGGVVWLVVGRSFREGDLAEVSGSAVPVGEGRALCGRDGMAVKWPLVLCDGVEFVEIEVLGLVVVLERWFRR